MLKHATGIESFKGLTDEEATMRLAEDGYNELPATKGRSILHIAFEVMHEPMFLLLIAGGLIYLVIGDVEEAMMLLCFVFFVIGITVYQEQKVERALEALRDLSSPRAFVIRGGERKMVPGREVVRGDLIMLSEGDRVPGDAILLSCSNILVDESLLTGESAPVRKMPGDEGAEMTRPGGDDHSSVYSSTLVVQGHGIARVVRIGISTEIGKIGKALQTLEPEETPLQKETNKLVKVFAIMGLAVCAIVIAVYGLTTGAWLNGLLAGLTLAMALVPEEIPVVLTIFLALGAWRMSKHKVLTRRLQAIQTLGSTTTLCVDKTGTLTMNRMQVERLYAGESLLFVNKAVKALPEEFHQLMEFSILASQRDPFDPMEKSLKELGARTLENTEHIHDDWTLVQEYALSKKLLALSHVWKSPAGDEYMIAAKGAPEAVFDLCHMEKSGVAQLELKVHEMAKEGLRVIGVARAYFRRTVLPADQHDFNFEFIGLVGFQDPVRLQVAESVKECYEAGIRVIMITGDYPVTAKNIAQQVGITPHDDIITGQELDTLSERELQERIKTANVFARVVPEQKLKIVNALKANGEVVMMTGDGVNDAPALKAAHIGIAMGGRGTEVAREASSLVLLDDNFSSIVAAIKMGRRIFDNLKKAIAYIFAIHVPIAGMSLLPVLFRWPLALFPAHIAFLELIIDPVCSILFEAEPEEKDVMNRPPRRLDEPFFDRKTIFLSIVQGIVVLAVVASVFRISGRLGQTEDQSRAIAFTTLVVANLSLILTNRSWTRTVLETLRTPNRAVVWVSGAAITLLLVSLYVPFFARMFKFGELHGMDLALSLAAGIVSILWFEAFKIAGRHKHKLRISRA
ncbi:MAG: cation-translocating P-type ATPase [Candidatus Altiarchaeota archaeon]|nr:cation-translocating P-type ATPase [Candidatus Altiarchaeota archaeon]